MRRRRGGIPLVLAGFAVLVAAGVVVARAVRDGGPADPRGARVETLTVDSAAVGRRQRVSVVIPAGAGARRPLLVFLHGRGGNERSLLRDAMFSGLARLGPRAPVVAFPDGGGSSYWHDRGSGAWGRYVLREVIPAVRRRFGTDRRRVAIGGISMGGFGALDLAGRRPGRFCAVGGHSAALWRTPGETAPGAFDDAADFARHDPIARARASVRPPARLVWLDAGEDDPFRPGQRALLDALRAQGAAPTAHVWPGGHDDGYWDRHWPAYLRFYADALAAC